MCFHFLSFYRFLIFTVSDGENVSAKVEYLDSLGFASIAGALTAAGAREQALTVLRCEPN